MKRKNLKKCLFVALVLVGATNCAPSKKSNVQEQEISSPETVVSIQGEKFFINDKPTYEGRTWQGYPIEGLLMNSRMVQGIFDDLNPETADQWKYPDTQVWDANRNTDEFIKAMDDWYAHGLLAFTINLQGGSPLGYGNKGWINSAIDPKGELRPEYMARLEKILDRANEKGMVAILGLFYFGQDEFLENEEAIIKGVDNTIDWLFAKNYRHVLIEINNESDIEYDHDILKSDNVHTLITRVKAAEQNGYRFLVGTSFSGGKVPTSNVVSVSDFILIHGNGVGNPARITEMVDEVRQVEGYQPMPVLYNEDDHFNFDQDDNNFVRAVKSYTSWGYFDYRMKDEGFDEGYQSVPVNWEISSPRKQAFFNKLKEITGGLE